MKAARCFVFNIFKEKVGKGIFSINFWRTKDGAEVDFVLDLDREILPIEVKYKELSRIEISRSLRSFIARYKPKRAWVMNLNFKGIEALIFSAVF